ncbi:MAG TPA: TolC family protein [Gemmatimonadales bacterium]|nr:TolC family protein [Gemmatimonadales bacterium]
MNRLWAMGYGLLVLASRPLAAQAPLTLQQVIALAQQQGFAARAAQATRDAARYRDRAFYSRLLPQLSLGGTMPSYNRAIIPVLQPDGSTLFKPQNQTDASLRATLTQKVPLTGGDFFVSSALARVSVTGQNSFHSWSSTPVSFGLRQDLLRPNVAAWDRREQPLRAELAERGYLEAREDIALTTSNLFFDVYAARVAVANQIKNVAVNDTLFTLNKGRFEVGKIGENDLLQSELALLRARTSLDGARLESDRAVAALRLALNLPVGAPLDIEVTSTIPDFEPDTARAVAEALKHRASMSEVALQEVQARRRVTEARLSNWLGASVSASYGFNATAPDASAVYSNLLNAQQFTVSLSLPLWQWGAHQEGVKAAQAEQERSSSLAQSTVQQTAQDAHFAALQLSQAKRNVALSAKADTVAGKRFEVALNRYSISRITIDNLYIAQNEKDQALTGFVQSLRGYWQAYYRLRRMTLFDFAMGEVIR